MSKEDGTRWPGPDQQVEPVGSLISELTADRDRWKALAGRAVALLVEHRCHASSLTWNCRGHQHVNERCLCFETMERWSSVMNDPTGQRALEEWQEMRQQLIERDEMIAAIACAFRMVNHWYESDEQARPLPDKITDAVLDLQTDRTENLRLRQQLSDEREARNHIARECADLRDRQHDTNQRDRELTHREHSDDQEMTGLIGRIGQLEQHLSAREQRVEQLIKLFNKTIPVLIRTRQEGIHKWHCSMALDTSGRCTCYASAQNIYNDAADLIIELRAALATEK
jgi:hypothetical protein